MKRKKILAVASSLFAAVLASGCNEEPDGGFSTLTFMPAIKTIKGISKLEVNGRVKKGGAPFANRVLTFTSTNYYASLAMNQTLNAGVQTDAAGSFKLDATPILCAARLDYVEFMQHIREIDNTYDGSSKAIILGIINWFDKDGAQHSVVSDFETKVTPRSICYNYDPSQNEFALGKASLDTNERMKPRDKQSILESKVNQAIADTLAAIDDEKLRGKIRSEITPLEVGVINSADAEEKTNGRIVGIRLEEIASETPETNPIVPHDTGTDSEGYWESFKFSDPNKISFVKIPNPQTAEMEPKAGWGYGKLFKLVVDIEFDLATPTLEAPGMLAKKLLQGKRKDAFGRESDKYEASRSAGKSVPGNMNGIQREPVRSSSKRAI